MKLSKFSMGASALAMSMGAVVANAETIDMQAYVEAD